MLISTCIYQCHKFAYRCIYNTHLNHTAGADSELQRRASFVARIEHITCCVAVRCSVMQCVAVCCSVLQCVAVCVAVCVVDCTGKPQS